MHEDPFTPESAYTPSETAELHHRELADLKQLLAEVASSNLRRSSVLLRL